MAETGENRKYEHKRPLTGDEPGIVITSGMFSQGREVKKIKEEKNKKEEITKFLNSDDEMRNAAKPVYSDELGETVFTIEAIDNSSEREEHGGQR